jgi:hypothetical protein
VGPQALLVMPKASIHIQRVGTGAVCTFTALQLRDRGCGDHQAGKGSIITRDRCESQNTVHS